MLDNIASNTTIQNLFASCAKGFIQTLRSEGLEFSILCDTGIVHFEPPLSFELRNRIGKVSIFVLSGYSFESIQTFGNYFTFEAGLILENGKDVGTLLKVPYMSVVQILIQDEESSQSIPIFINPFESSKVQALDDSIAAILSNNMDLIEGRE